MAIIINSESALDDAGGVQNRLLQLAPWLAGSGIALGQAMLATACTLPTVGKCAGCGSCVVGVVALSSWAIKRRKADALAKAQGLEPFEIRTAPANE